MPSIIRNAIIINEGKRAESDVLIRAGRIERIDPVIDVKYMTEEIDGEGHYLIPGIIDDQVHFREPGLTHKGDLHSESRAAAAGGVTSFMEMPNTRPPALTRKLLEEKYAIASRSSIVNYSFYMGAANDNLEEITSVDSEKVCGIKVFMGSSTGNMLVDDERALENIFRHAHIPLAAHCEDEETVRRNLEIFKKKYGDNIPPHAHPEIRTREACLLSSSKAVSLAKKFSARLHILHISTADELELFSPGPVRDKQITSEVCVHHLWFDSSRYAGLGNKIKCNPSVKAASDREALMKGLQDDRLDIIATDHAPHTAEEKQKGYLESPSGLPLIQHSLLMMLKFVHEGIITMEKVVEKMCHSPADCFLVRNRGYVREGYHADLVIVDPAGVQVVAPSSLLYKCGWSPLEGENLTGRIVRTLVNGKTVYSGGKIIEAGSGERMMFDRQGGRA